MLTWQDIPGWFDFHDVYDEAIARAKPGAVLVEIGCWLGRSSAYLIEKAHGLSVTLVFVDTWKGEPGQAQHETVVEQHGGSVYHQWEQNMRDCGFRLEGDKPTIVPLEMTSVDASGLFDNKSVDFVFVDAAHDYDSVHQDLTAWLPKLKHDGHIAGHDWEWHEVRRAVLELVDAEQRGSSWERKRPR